MDFTILTSILSGGLGVFAGWFIFRRFGRTASVRSQMTNFKHVPAQCSHAALACYEEIISQNPGILKTWESQGQPKIVLRVDSYDDMLKLSNKAESLGLVNSIIHDAGHTQVAAGTATVLGIGPGLASEIDRVSGDLKLLP
ncbi:unnamed protein product [Trichobilharzia szidati]|nr:unnamed protein product [Trichobilharzia szidati]